MKIVKLNAIDSTNSYLRDLIKNNEVDDWTVITARHQTHGRGQFDNKWSSVKDKNLTFSMLVRPHNLMIENQFYLNFSISLAIYHVLKYYIPEKLFVKWPNDILSANQKICGILIESSIKNTKVNHAIVGIGLNVNQEKFSASMSNATSLKLQLKRTIDKEELLQKIILEIQYQILLIQKSRFDEIKQQYEAVLYKKGVPSMFINGQQETFLGKIVGISATGKLQVAIGDESIKEFDLKEIRFA